MRNAGTSSWSGVAAVWAMLALATQAHATADFTIEFGPDLRSLSAWTPGDLGEVSNPDGTVSFSGDSPFGGGVYSAAWDVLTDAGPFVDGVFAITNNNEDDQTFIITFEVPVVPSLAVATGGASVIGTLTVDGDGGTLGHVPDGPDPDSDPDPMFQALVDGVRFMSLHPDARRLRVVHESLRGRSRAHDRCTGRCRPARHRDRPPPPIGPPPAAWLAGRRRADRPAHGGTVSRHARRRAFTPLRRRARGGSRA